MRRIALTKGQVYPEVYLDSSGHLIPGQAPGSPGKLFPRGLELVAIAIDEMACPLFAGIPRAAVNRLFGRIDRRWQGPQRIGSSESFDTLRFQSAAATVLLNMAEGLKAATPPLLKRKILDTYFEILDHTRSLRLRKSMILNLVRVKKILDEQDRAELDRRLDQLVPQTPPYAQWFSGEKKELRIICQVQDVFYKPWQRFLHRQGFRTARSHGPRDLYLRRVVRVEGQTMEFQVRYLEKAEGIFTPMKDPNADVVIFIGHSDWWARIPRNLKKAPDQKGPKLLVLILCFGKHFYQSLHERYPAAQIVTSKDPTDDPEDHVLVKHLLQGIAARKTWVAIERVVNRDPRNPDRNFILPNDEMYVAGVLDDDRDGRADRYDRFCNIGDLLPEEPENIEESYVPDPLGIHPRGVELNPREFEGSKVFEAALMINSLTYDNYFLTQVNPAQTAISGGWHLPNFGELQAARFTPIRRDQRDMIRLTASIRYARSAQSALTAMVVYEGYQYFSKKLKPRQQPLDTALMGIILVTQALINSDYPHHEEAYYAFLRRYGFPRIDIHLVSGVIEADPNWESGSPGSLRVLKRKLPVGTLGLLQKLAFPPPFSLRRRG